MRVFGLSCGRSGSVTFAMAAGHASNFTSGHESRWGYQRLDERLDYPQRHIESDMELTFMLGSLARRFDDDETLYVHLLRDAEATARSWAKRVPDAQPWHFWARNEVRKLVKRRYTQTYGHAIAHQFFGKGAHLDFPQVLDASRSYVEMMNDQITEFLRHRSSIIIRVETPEAGLAEVWERSGAAGDFSAALAEYGVRHNAS